MTSETDTPESLIIQATNEEDINRTNRECTIGTEIHPKEHITFKDVVQTSCEQIKGTNDDEQTKHCVDNTDGECFLYPPSVEKVAYGDMFRQSGDCPERISDDAVITISKTNDQQQDSKKIETAEEQPTETGLDAKGKETFESVISTNQELDSERHNEGMSNIEKENKENSEMDDQKEHLDNFSVLEKKTVEIPVCVLDQQLVGFEMDAKSESDACDSTKCIERTLSRNPTALPGQLEATASGAEDLDKAITAVVKGPEIVMAQTVNKSTQKDGDEKMTSSGLAAISMSQTSISPIDSKESISETKKDLKEIVMSSQKSTDTVEEKKGLHEVGTDNNLDEASRSFFEKEFEDPTGTSTTLKNKLETEDKSHIESQGEEMDRDKGEKHEEDNLLSKVDSEITVKEPLEKSMENPEECIVRAAVRQEGRERENLEEALISENIEAVEKKENDTVFVETKLGMANSDDQGNENDTVGADNCDTAGIYQDNTTEANINETTNFRESIIFQNEEDFCLANNTVAIESGDEKKERCSEFQIKEQEKQDIDVSKEENFHNEHASEVSKEIEFTSFEETKTKGVDIAASITKEEKMPVAESEPEERQEMQSEEEFTEAETKRKASDSNLQESIACTKQNSSLIENKDKDSASGEEHLAEISIINKTTEEISEAVVRKMPSNSIPDEISEEQYMLPEKKPDISVLEGSKTTNESETPFCAINRDDGPTQMEDQSKNSNDVSKKESVLTGKAGQAQEKHENREMTELDSETDETDRVKDIDRVNIQIGEGKNDHGDHNQENYIDFEAVGPQGDAKVTTTTSSASAFLSNDSIEFAEREEATLKETYNQENEEANNINDIASTEEDFEPVAAVEKLDSCTNSDVTCEYSVKSAEAMKSGNGESNMKKEEQDINAELDSFEGQKDEITHEQIGSNEIYETEMANDENIVNHSSEESDFCSGKHSQEIIGAYITVIEVENLVPMKDECCRISSEVIQVGEVGEEVIDKQQCSGETENPNETTNGVSACKARGVEIEQENENSMNIVEDVNQEFQNINAESESIEVLQDKKRYEDEGEETNVVNNEEVTNQNFEESDSCKGNQDEEKVKSSTPLIEAENLVSSKDECTRDQVNEIKEETVVDKQPGRPDTGNLHEVRVEILPENENSKSILEDANQDMNAQSGSFGAEKDEKTNEQTCSNEIHETEAVNDEEIVNQSFKASNSCTRKQNEKIAQESTLLLEAQNLVPSYDKCSKISSDDFQYGEAIEQQSVENAKPKIIKNGASSCEVKRVEIAQENENSTYIVKDLEKDINAESESIEVQTNEQIGSSEIQEAKAVNNEEIVSQRSKESDSSSGKQDQEISQRTTPIIEAENPVLSKDQCTSTSSKVQVSEVKEEAGINQQQCISETVNPTTTKSSVCSHEVREGEVLLEKENSISIQEDADQDMYALSSSFEVQQEEKTNKQSCLNEIHETEVVNSKDIANRDSNKSDSCRRKENQEIDQASTPHLGAKNPVSSNDECTKIFSEEIQVTEMEEQAAVEEQKRCTDNENLNKTTNSVSSNEVTRVEIVHEKENPLSIVEDEDQDLNAESASIEVLQDENARDHTFKDIHETEAINNEEIVNQSSEGNDPCSGEENQKIDRASPPFLEVEIPVPTNEKCCKISSEEVQDSEVGEELAIKEQQCIEEKEHPNKTTSGVSSNEVMRVENLQDIENNVQIVHDVDQDINFGSKTIELLQDESTYDQSGLKDNNETEADNNEEIVNLSFEESNSCCGMEDQETARASKPLLKDENPVPCIDDCTNEDNKVSEVEGKAAIEEQQGSAKNEHPNKTSSVSPNEVTIVKIVQENENSMNIVEDVDQKFQDINAETDSTKVLQDENIHDQTGSNDIQDTKEVKNEEIANQSSKESDSYSEKEIQETARVSTKLLEAEIPVPNNDECSRIPNEEIQASEVEEKAELGEQQCSAENENPNKTREGVYSLEVREEETLPVNENFMIIQEEINQKMNAQSSSIEVQLDEEIEKTCSNDIQETEVVNNEEILTQSYKEKDSCRGKQDQELVQASTLLTETENEDPNKIKNDVTSIEVTEVEVLQDNEYSTNIVKDVDQDIYTEAKSIEAQSDANTHTETSSFEICDTKVVTHEEIVNLISEEKDPNSGKQDQGIVEASTSLIEIEIPSKDECTKLTREEFQVTEVEEEVAVEKQQCSAENEDNNMIIYGVCPHEVKGEKIEQENEISMKSIKEVDEDINVESIKVQRDEETQERTGSHEIYGTEAVNNEEIMSQNSSGKQEQEIAEASTLLKEAENLLIASKDECTRISSEEIQVTAVDEEVKDSDNTKNSVSSNEIRVPEVEKTMATVEIMDQAVNNEEIVNQCSEERESYNGKHEKEITQASSPLTEAKNPVPSIDECTRIPSGNIQEVEEEATIDIQKSSSETMDGNKIKNGVSYMIKEGEILPETENSLNIMEDALQQVEKNLEPYGNTLSNKKQCTEEDSHHATIGDLADDKDNNVQSDSIEEQTDEKACEQTCPNEIYETEAVSHVKTENQSFENSDAFNEKQDQEIARAFTPVIKVDNHVPSQDECTSISSEDFQVSKVNEEETIEKQQCSSETEAPKKINDDVSSHENIEPAAVKEMLTCSSELIELRDANSDENNVINRNVKDHGANSTGKPIEKGCRKIQMEEISQDESTTEKAKDANQIDKEHPSIERECKQDDSQQPITQEKSDHEQEDERNMCDKQLLEGKETPELYKTSEFEESLSFTESETVNQEIQVDNFRDKKPYQQTSVDTEASGQNGCAEMGNLDQGQSAKLSNDHTQLLEFNKAAGLDSEHHKHENEGSEDMNNSLEKEVKHANTLISKNEMETVSDQKKESIEEHKVAICDTTSKKVLLNDPTLGQQNLQENESLDKEEKMVLGEEHEMITDDITDAQSTRQGPPEHKDSKEFSQIEDTREFDIPHVQCTVGEKEQEFQGNCDKHPALSHSCTNVSIEEGGNEEHANASVITGEKRQLQTDSKEEPGKHSETEACEQKGITIIESERNGVASNDPVKENLDGYPKRADENSKEKQTHSIALDSTNKDQEMVLQKETKESSEFAAEKPKSDKEKDEDDEEQEDLKVPLISEGLREMELKTTQKRSHNILSGVGSKVKHSISKVKKAMTCSSSQFEPEDIIIKLNKNKKSSDKA